MGTYIFRIVCFASFTLFFTISLQVSAKDGFIVAKSQCGYKGPPRKTGKLCRDTKVGTTLSQTYTEYVVSSCKEKGINRMNYYYVCSALQWTLANKVKKRGRWSCTWKSGSKRNVRFFRIDRANQKSPFCKEMNDKWARTHKLPAIF